MLEDDDPGESIDRLIFRGSICSGCCTGVDVLFKLRSAIFEDGGIGNLGIGRINLACRSVRFSIEASLDNGKAAG